MRNGSEDGFFPLSPTRALTQDLVLYHVVMYYNNIFVTYRLEAE